MFSALITGGGGTAARDAASARSASRALCGVIVSGSRSGSSGMIWAMTGSSGVIMRGFLMGFVCASIGSACGGGNHRPVSGTEQGIQIDIDLAGRSDMADFKALRLEAVFHQPDLLDAD